MGQMYMLMECHVWGAMLECYQSNIAELKDCFLDDRMICRKNSFSVVTDCNCVLLQLVDILYKY